MLGLKADAYDINNSGDGQYAFFSDIGTRALQSVRVGEGAGKISQGTANTFVGYETGKENRAGSFGVFVGFQAGQLNQQGNLNTFVGAYAGRENNRGDRNTFVGYQAGAVNRDGDECTGVGAFALRENTTGNRNVAVGNRAGERILDGDANTMIGVEAGQDIRSGTNNTMSGFRAGRGSFKGNENTYFGSFSGYSNSYGDGNAFVGFKAGEYLTIGNYNVAVGAYALQKASSGSCNIAIGAFAGSILSGSGNVFVGTGAGASNPAGENNTNVGNNAGFEGTGTDNVYIGKDAAYSLDGNQNVVVGVAAMQDIQTTGSVVIGYNAANATFQRGNCNVFIGVGADAFFSDTSYAIAIGANRTRAFNHSISVGENIDTAGTNSISLGYQITADSDQCVGVGNSISVNSAEVFNDPLNFRFPVNLTEAYNTFYLTENYTDTLYLNNTSNTIAIATIDSSNVYDSGTNTLQGTTQTQDIDLRALFTYGIFYQGSTPYPPTTLNLTDHLNSNLTTQGAGFSATDLTVENPGTYDIATNLAAPFFTIPFNGLSLPFLTNVNCNLIPITTPRFVFTAATPKRQSLYKLTAPNDLTISRASPTPAGEVEAESQLADFTYYNYPYQQPTYGFIDSNLTYQPYPETLFNSNDTYIMATVNQLSNIHPNDSNIYGIVSSQLYYSTYLRHPTPTYKQQPLVYMHPSYSNRLDQSYFFYLPISNLSSLTLESLDSNLLLSSSNYSDFPYLSLQDPTSNVTQPLRLHAPPYTYDFTISYNCNVATNSRQNLLLTVQPFSLSNYYLPLSPASNTQVYTTPTYGNVAITPTAITYTTTQINFGQDHFTLLLQPTPYQHTYYDINVQMADRFRAVPVLHKMQEPPQVTLDQTFSSLSPPSQELLFLTTTYCNVLQVTLTGAEPPAIFPSSFSTRTTFPYTAPYLANLGYIQTSNNTGFLNYQNVTYQDPNFFNLYPSTNTLSNNSYHDFIKYYPQLPRILYSYYRSNEPTPYYQVQCNLTTQIDEVIPTGTGLGKNRYYLLDKSFSNETYYYQACNITIFNSNLTITFDNYYDLYQNFIYTKESSNLLPQATSNYSLMLPNPDPRYTITSYQVTTTHYVTSNIPTIQLQDTLLYHYNAPYTLLSPPTNPNLLLLQQNKGPITQFHQSNITHKEIHIWNQCNIDTIITPSVYFSGSRKIDLVYYPNSTATLTPLTSTPTITYNNQAPTTAFAFPPFQGVNDRILIQHTCNVSFCDPDTFEPITNYDFGPTNHPFPVPSLSYSNDCFIDYIVFVTNAAIDPFKKPYRIQPSTFYRKNKPLAYNLAPIANSIRTLTSNEIYHSPEETYTVGSLNQATLLLNNTPLSPTDTFTQEDINQGRLTFTAPTSTTFTLTTPTTQTYTLNAYAAPEFPASNITGCNVILQLKDTYQQYQFGPLWEFFQNNPQDYTFKILQQPSHGCFTNSNGDVLNTFTRTEVPSTVYYYVPYNSNLLPNDQFTAYFEYNTIASPPYTLTIKNYWSRWSNIDIPVNNGIFSAAPPSATFYTSNLPRSQGMVQDNFFWSPPAITLPYNTASNVTLSLNYLNQTIPTDIRTLPLTQQPIFSTSNNPLNVDNSGYIYLDSLLPTTTGTMFYITQAPTQGVILTRLTDNQFQALPYFSRQDILNKKVFYQHYGINLTQAPLQNDLFLVKTTTTPFDLSEGVLSNQVFLSEAPKLLTNNYDYIFYPNLQEGSNSYNPLNTNKLDISKGYLYAYQLSNLDLFIKNGTTYTPTQIITDEDLTNNKAFYRPSSDFFTPGFNKNEPLTMTFTLGSNVNNFEANPLSVYPQYQNLFNQSWIAKFNTYESVNVIRSTINSNQSISYTRFVNTTSNISFADKKCQIEFEYLPTQTDLVNPTYIDFIQTFSYTFQLLDLTDQPLLTATFTHSNLTIISSNETVLSITPSTPFDSTTWTKFTFINFDSLNENNLSLFLNDTNYTQGQNIPSLDLTNLKQIKINVPITDPLNYYNVTQTSNIAPQTNVYYNLINYNTQLRFRNFNIYLATTEIGGFTTNTYNIALGNKLDIRGINNICLGKDFRTTGKNSIILGNEIGVQGGEEGVLNEIFNSIVISNNSFTNSKVRDVIAIGNSILNDITTNIEDFLSKKPVIVGNNIDSSKIDFHINFQNTFLKTTVGSPQIYCGLEGEHVCIGYTSNEQISTANVLHVKGGAEIHGPWEVIHSGQRLTKIVFGNLLFTTGTTHTQRALITWSNTQTTDYNAFSINGKFRCINTDSSYLFRRFEIFVTPKNDSGNNKPNALSDLEISSFTTPDITSLTHNIERVGEKSVYVVISWVTAETLTPTAYGQATLEIETSTPTALGNVTITVV